MKKSKIAQIAPLWIPVPPRTYGGIELMLSLLTDELINRGYQVTLFASGDSKTKAKLVPLVETAIWLQKSLRSPHAYISSALKKIGSQTHHFDLIHNHFDFFMLPLSLIDPVRNNISNRVDNKTKKTPILTTLHRPLDQATIEVYKSYNSQMKFCAISQDQRQSAEENNIPIIDVVYNGINPADYTFNESPEDYFMYLGRLNKEKGILQALQVAKEAQVKLIVAGNIVGGEEWNYFLHEVQPYLNDENVKFVGQVGFNEKVKLLSKAKGLLYPIDRREPFGLAMIEAMACGTPVIAFKKGSVPEVVADRKTGFIVETKEEIIQAMKKINTINRKDCRTHVEQNFTLKQMVDKYEEIYKKLI